MRREKGASVVVVKLPIYDFLETNFLHFWSYGQVLQHDWRLSDLEEAIICVDVVKS